MTLFTVVTLLISPLDIIDIAKHQITLNFNSLIFILPISLTTTITIHINYRLNQNSTLNTQTATQTKLIINIYITTLTTIFTISLQKQIALLYNDNPEIITLTTHLILLTTIYQISNSIQIINNKILHNYKNTHSIFYITFTTY